MKNDERFYNTPFGYLPSVTTVLSILNKPALMHWAVKITVQYIGTHLEELKNSLTEEEAIRILEEAKKETERQQERALNIGSLVHQWIERWTEGEIEEISLEIKQPVGAFLEWTKSNNFIVLEKEQTVYSKKGFAGTLDLVAKLNKKLYIIDIKTSSGFYPEYVLQIGAYKMAYEEMKKTKRLKMGILRLDKVTGSPEFKDYSNEYSKASKAFLHLLGYWRLQKGGKKNG